VFVLKSSINYLSFEDTASLCPATWSIQNAFCAKDTIDSVIVWEWLCSVVIAIKRWGYKDQQLYQVPGVLLLTRVPLCLGE
jgi:hypothetical protein